MVPDVQTAALRRAPFALTHDPPIRSGIFGPIEPRKLNVTIPPHSQGGFPNWLTR
jgi:hypothetical protein